MVPPEVLRVCQSSANIKLKKSPLFQKNATPQESAVELENVFDGVQPKCVISGRTSDAGCNVNDLMRAAFSRFKTAHIQTGNKFVPQWDPRYIEAKVSPEV